MATRKGGLGKGLDSLIADKVGTSNEKTDAKNEVMVNINKVEPNKDQPRKSFNEDSLIELSESIKQHGIVQPLVVAKKDDYFEKISEDGNKMIEWIIPNAQKNSMEPVRLTLKPGGSSDTHLPHAGEEFGYVLKGTVRVFYGGRTYTVRAGESFYFQAGKKHRLENNGNRDAILIWVSTPPSF